LSQIHPALVSEIKKAGISRNGINFPLQEKKLPETITQEGFRDKLVDFVVSTSQPFSIAEDPSFKQLIEYLSRKHPSVNVPGRLTLKEDISKKFDTERQKIKEDLAHNSSLFSFIIDCWTSSNQNPFLGIIITWVDDAWNLQTRVLDLMHLKGSHTGKNLSEAFITAIEAFELQHKVLAITGDNAKNIDTMCTEFQEYAIKQSSPFRAEAHRIRCFAHILNLTTQAMLKQFEDVNEDEDENVIPSKSLSKLRKIVTLIRSSPQRREIFNAHCIAAAKPPKSLILDVKTRWNSTMMMIERALEYKEIIDMATTSIKELRRAFLEDDEWKILKELVEILVPFQQATVIMSTQSSPTLSRITGMYQALLDHLEASIERQENTHIGKAASEGREKLLSYYTTCDGASCIIATGKFGGTGEYIFIPHTHGQNHVFNTITFV